MLIREGLVHQVRCPDLECSAKKEDDNEPPSQEELILIVGQDLANRYDRLQLQLKLQADPSITFCPRLQCQQPVVKDKNYDKLCCCSACGYAFCLICEYWKIMTMCTHSPSTVFLTPSYQVKRHGMASKYIVSLKTHLQSCNNILIVKTIRTN